MAQELGTRANVGHSGDNAGTRRGHLSHRHHVLLVPLIRPLRDCHLWTALNTEIQTYTACLITGALELVPTTCGTTVRTPMKLSSSVNCSNRERYIALISAPIHINCKEIQRPLHMHTRCGTTVPIHTTLSSLASCDPILNIEQNLNDQLNFCEQD